MAATSQINIAMKKICEWLTVVWLGWYSNWGTWRVDATRRAFDIWKIRLVFGKYRPIDVYAAHRRFERLLGK